MTLQTPVTQVSTMAPPTRNKDHACHLVAPEGITVLDITDHTLLNPATGSLRVAVAQDRGLCLIHCYNQQILNNYMNSL